MAEFGKPITPFYTYYVIRTLPNKRNAEYFGGPFNNHNQARAWLLDNEIMFTGASYEVVEVIHHGSII